MRKTKACWRGTLAKKSTAITTENARDRTTKTTKKKSSPEVGARGSDGLAAAMNIAGTANSEAVATRLISVVAR